MSKSTRMTIRPEQIAAMTAVLQEQAITRDEAEAAKFWGASWSTRSAGWTIEVSPEDVVVVAHVKTVLRETPEEAVADALRLRAAILDAAGLASVRGFVAADTANDGELAVSGWLGAVKLVIPADR